VSEKLIDEEINYANSVSLFLEKQHLSSFWQVLKTIVILWVCVSLWFKYLD